MKFTVERQTLIRMLERAGRKSPARKRRDEVVRLSACGPWVFVQGNGRAVGTAALVFGEGTSRLVPNTLLRLLRRRAHKANVTFEADPCVFELDGGNWPISGFSNQATPPLEFEEFSAVGPLGTARRRLKRTKRTFHPLGRLMSDL